MTAEPKKAPWPKQSAELTAQGYVFSGRGVCKGCQRSIIWATTPKGNRMPLSSAGENSWQPHFTDCTQANRFRRHRPVRID